MRRTNADVPCPRCLTWILIILGLSLLGCTLPGRVGDLFRSSTPTPTTTSTRTPTFTATATATFSPTPTTTQKPSFTLEVTRSISPTPVRISPLPGSSPLPPTLTPGPGELTSGQDVWQVTSIEFPSYISINGRLFYPAQNRRSVLLSYSFMRINFECTTGKSLINLWAGKDMGLTFINEARGYPNVALSDFQGRSYLATLMGACWLAFPVPTSRIESSRFNLRFKDLPPLDLGFQTLAQSQPAAIAFSSDRGGDIEIYLLQPEGGGVTRLTFRAGRDIEPAWSPDRQQIAFTGEGSGLADLYFMPAGQNQAAVTPSHGANAVNLTNSPDLEEGGPAWDPTGKQIAFHARVDGIWQIFRMPATPGAAVQRLTAGTADNQYPAFSPDGLRILYQSDRDGDWDIYEMEANGKVLRALTSTPADDILPTWSPDGSQIAFWSRRDGYWRLYVMDANGSNATPITQFDNPGNPPSRPTWSPDGKSLVIALFRQTTRELYLISSDGTDSSRLTNNQADDFDPAWR